MNWIRFRNCLFGFRIEINERDRAQIETNKAYILHFGVNSLKSESYQNGRWEENFKCVAIIDMFRGTMHALMSS